MNFNGRTVLFLVALGIVLSSLVTMLVLDSAQQQVENLPPAESSDSVADGSNESIANATDEEESAQQEEMSEEVQDMMDKVQEAYDIIHNHYVLDIGDEELLEGAIEGMLNTLEDPYSVYMDPDTAEQFQSNLQSSFEGIGAEVISREGRVTVVAPIRGSPAEEAGLRPNDQIVEVNDLNIEGMDVHEAVSEIRGPRGTEAVLKIDRPGLTDTITITVVRDEIPLETVYAETIHTGGKQIGLIQLTSFAQQTAERFEEELTQLEQDHVDGLVIDVRGNPGGYLDAVQEIGKLIVPDESIITEIENRQGEKMVYRSTLEERKPYPIAVLTDDGSASASEILAAALQEAGDYPVVGESSFGKGTVQSTIEMEDTSEIKLTIAKWLTPDGNSIDGEGVQPDVEVSQPEFFRAVAVQTDPPLEKDMNNEDVRNLQIILDGLGYDPGRQDGFFSPETESAVRLFQTQHHLNVTGIVDEDTAIAMQDQLVELVQDLEQDQQLQKAIEVLIEEM